MMTSCLKFSINRIQRGGAERLFLKEGIGCGQGQGQGPRLGWEGSSGTPETVSHHLPALTASDPY